MPRTIDSMVESHRVATSLRDAGRPIWTKKINIKSILSEDRGNKSDEHAVYVATRIAAQIRASVPKGWLDYESEDWDSELIEIVENFEDVRPDRVVDGQQFRAIDDLNQTLDCLYDWADYNRVWIS